MRGVKTRTSLRQRLYCGDYRFGSIYNLTNIANSGNNDMMSTTIHLQIPKNWIESQMKDFPGSTWIVMKGLEEKEKVSLFCIGYQYKKMKALLFLTTKGAGKLSYGKPYEAQLLDKFCNCASIMW